MALIEQSYFRRWTIGIAVTLICGLGSSAIAQTAQLKQSIADAASGNKVLVAYYQSTGFDTLWTGKDRDDRVRRKALLEALKDAPDHGLPADKYNYKVVEKKLKAARKASDRGRLDVELSALFLAYASDVRSGILDPRRLPKPLRDEIARKPQRLDPASLLAGVQKSGTSKFFDSLPPRSKEYTRLMGAKIDLEKIAKRGTWGETVDVGKLQPGDSGASVVALRNRLIRMGYMKRSSSSKFDDKLADGVRAFQSAHGLASDGVVGAGTLAMLNTSPTTRLAQVVVAMERERWTNFERGKRHVEVNIADYSAKIIDNGKVSFQTRAVVGRAKLDHRTPEFSDKMEYLVFNPSWYVPRGIATSEYLPMLQEDPFAVSHLQLLDDDGAAVDRMAVDFASLDEDTWPFWLKEPPSQGNALGLVKFMFPNRHNIYLHDTPAKSLFNKEVRAFSHGCIRLGDPFGFADKILSVQSSNPQSTIKNALAGTEEYHLGLKKHVPVHLIYRTARVTAGGDMVFRRDIYGRDKAIFAALQRAGVELFPGS